LIGWAATHVGLKWPNIVAALVCLCGVLLMLRERREMRRFFERDGASDGQS
jgi:hypothetical protein